MVELVVRLVFSLAVVVGMLLALAKLSARRFRGSGDALVRVLHRQPLTRGAGVAVVTVGSRVLVLGTTEQQVQLLTELDPEDIGEDLGGDTSGDFAGDIAGDFAGDDATTDPVGPAARPRGASDDFERQLARAVSGHASDEFEGAGAAAQGTVSGGVVVGIGAASRRTAERRWVRSETGARALRPTGRTRAAGRHARAADTALAGSLLSAQTWRQAFAAATGKARDAS